MGALRLGHLSRITSDVDVLHVDDMEIALPEDPAERAAQPTEGTTLGHQLNARREGLEPQQESPRATSSLNRTQAALESVSAYVPGEALGFYITATALLGTPTFVSDAVISAATVVLAALLVIVAYHQIPSKDRSKSKFRWAMSFAILGAAVFTSASPASFTHHWDVYTGPVSAVVVIFASIFMTSVGSLVGLTSWPRRP